MTRGDAAIVVAGLVRAFGPLRALDDVSFVVPRGEVVALLGHNGAGKTTLIRMLNGLLSPTAGTISVLGMDPVVDGQAVRDRTGVLTEYPALDDFLTVRENMEAFGAMYGLGADAIQHRASDLLADLGMLERQHTPTRDLSAGLKQRAALARAMLHQPEILLLDEPTSNLDPLAARQVRRLVADRSRTHGTTVVVSTHNLAEASAIADRVVVLQEGRLLAHATMDELTAGGARAHVAITTDADSHRLAMTVAARTSGPVEALRALHTFSVSTHRVPIATLVRALVEAGVDIVGVVPMVPSLEDVYVSLHAPTPDPTNPDATIRDGLVDEVAG